MLIAQIALSAGAATPVPASAADVTIDGAGADRFGFEITSGDLNADGVPDVVISAPHEGSSGNAVYVFFGPLDLTSNPSLDTADADVVVKGQLGSETGWAVAVGDLFGGREDDLVVAAPSELPGGYGRVVAYHGPLTSGTTLDTTSDPAFVADGVAPNGYAGWSLATGDWDGDGRDELAVGACGVDQGSGAAYLFDVDTAISPTNMANATATFTGIGQTGCSLANLGDFDDDGIEDLGIGSYGALVTSGFGWGGTVSVVYGRSAFLPSYSLVGWTGEDIANINAESTAANLGWDLASAGDLNFDGIPDLLIGAPAWRCTGQCAGAEKTGRMYVVLGSHSTGTDQDRMLVGNSQVDEIADMIYEAPNASEGVGQSVASAGFAGKAWGKFSHPALQYELVGPALLAGSRVDEAWVIPYDNRARLFAYPKYECEEDEELGLRCVDLRADIDPARGWRIDLGVAAGVHRIDGAPGSRVGFEVEGPGDLDGDGLNDFVVGATHQLMFDEPAGDGEALVFQGQ